MSSPDLVLFDFDGLLVNTEQLHYAAYQQLCRGEGFELPWSFSEYCGFAHQEATGLRDALSQMHAPFREWGPFYEEKCRIYSELVEGGRVALMPGVAELLSSLELPHAVVTHSRLEHIRLIRAQQPLLDQIPHWFTREDYSQPKPHPECYLTAIEQLGGERVIGFEDTPRGVRALVGAGVKAYIVCSSDYPLLEEATRLGAHHLDRMPPQV